MSTLTNKIDFALVFTVNNANPNGDPLDGNRPRTTYSGLGEVSDVCIKRKLRNRLLDMGENIFVQSDDRRAPGDDFRSLKDRADGSPALKDCTRRMNAKKGANKTEEPPASRDDYARIACETWFDVRAFGQVFAFPETPKKKNDKENEEAKESSDPVSVGVRGPVSIQTAFSIKPVNITSLQITKSVNLLTGDNPDAKGPDTMGMKHRVDHGVYRTYGSINVQCAQKTGFSDDDAEKLRRALLTLFCNDATAARPDGSMEVAALVWWKHDCPNGQYSAAKVHRSMKVECQGSEPPKISVDTAEIPNLSFEIFEGE